jgi:hypothetical protein
MYEDVKASKDKMVGQYELRISELTKELESLKLEQIQAVASAHTPEAAH